MQTEQRPLSGMEHTEVQVNTLQPGSKVGSLDKKSEGSPDKTKRMLAQNPDLIGSNLNLAVDRQMLNMLDKKLIEHD